jgi:hypothetical protein
MKKIILLFSTTLLIFSCLIEPAAQAQTSAMHVKRNIATVMLAGLGGAVLGASTLSFYSSPSDHTGNIWLGLAAGLVAGTVYVVNREMRTPAVDYGKVQWPTNPAQAQRQVPLYNYHWDF